VIEAMIRPRRGRRLVPGEVGRPPFTGVYHVAGPDRLTLEEIGVESRRHWVNGPPGVCESRWFADRWRP
jgi:hypothetical protein